jgi:hypothetical protein
MLNDLVPAQNFVTDCTSGGSSINTTQNHAETSSPVPDEFLSLIDQALSLDHSGGFGPTFYRRRSKAALIKIVRRLRAHSAASPAKPSRKERD